MPVAGVLVVLVVLEVPEELLELRGLSGGPGSVTLLCWVVSVGSICGGCAGGGSAQCAASVAALGCQAFSKERVQQCLLCGGSDVAAGLCAQSDRPAEVDQCACWLGGRGLLQLVQ